MIAVLRERLDDDPKVGLYVVAFHVEDGLPAHSRHEFDSLEQALEFFTLDWEEPPEDADNDVLKVAVA